MAPDPDEYVELTLDELREVVRFALASAEEVLDLFDAERPDDERPREATSAARACAEGQPRSVWQRTAALDAHRAATDTASEAVAHAASAAGDAAAAVYLHPLARASQVGHILRATAHAARAAELASGDPEAAARHLDEAVARASPVLLGVLRRYPPAPTGRTRVAELMSRLDARLRALP